MHGLAPFAFEAGPLETAFGALEIGQRGVVVLALFGVDDPQPLGPPQSGRKIGVGLLKLLSNGLCGVVAQILQVIILGLTHEIGEPF